MDRMTAQGPDIEFLYGDVQLLDVSGILNQMIKEAIRADSYSVLDCLLARMDCRRMRVVIMTAVLRTLWPIRDKLQDFKGACLKVRVNVHCRGQDPAVILRGLT